MSLQQHYHHDRENKQDSTHKDYQMRAPSNIHIAGIFFSIALVLLTLIVTHKSSSVETTAINNKDTSASNDSVIQYIEAVEKQNELERDQKEQANKRAKLTKAKRDSVECQFWMQQKRSKSTNPRVEEKIIQFCELPVEQNSSIAATNQQ